MVVLDTNLWVSYALLPESALGQQIRAIIQQAPYAFSKRTFTEFTDVIMRPKFDRYVSPQSRASFLKTVAARAEWFNPTEAITACRDHKDNMFLELAVTAQASHIISGDEDLLVLHPFRGISIVPARDYPEPI